VNSLLEIFASLKNFQVELSTIDTVEKCRSGVRGFNGAAVY
jgi:hypothetical protein